MQLQSASSPARAALAVLIVLQTVMIAALFSRTPPHPPIDVEPFAMAPFLAASIAVAVAALVLGDTGSRYGRVASLFAGLLALMSYGPQKWIDPAIGRIWPAVLLAQVAVLSIGLSCIVAGLRNEDVAR